MGMDATRTATVEAILERALRGDLSEADACRLYDFGPEAVTLVMLALARQVARQHAGSPPPIDPATPSGQVPVYLKPSAKKRRKRPGAKPGHPGTRRSPPDKIDRKKVHRLERCPQCDGKLQRSSRTRTRLIEDLLDVYELTATEHIIHRDYCPTCKKHVEPVVPDALPRCAIGHKLVALTSWFHYGLGITISQVVSILQYHLHTKLTPGGLVAMWLRLAWILEPWYDEIGRQARASAVLHADETGWRVEGQTCWLWCFANAQTCYYMIDGTRGSPAVLAFFTETFEGTLVTDFYRVYDSVCAASRQCCFPHLLREIVRVDQQNETFAWQAFSKKLRRLLQDALRLRARSDFTPEHYASRITCLEERLDLLAAGAYADADAIRLAKRLTRHRDHLLTFLHKPEVPSSNNFDERQIRPAVLIRKISQGNRSDHGAAAQAILMSIYRTLYLRGLNPTETIAAALRTYLTTGQLPPLPDAPIAHG